MNGIPKSVSWLTVFVPAFLYFLTSRLQSTRLAGRALGQLVSDELIQHDVGVDGNQLSSIFYVQKKKSSSSANANQDDNNNNNNNNNNIMKLQQGLHLVQSDGLKDIVDSTWKHDSELGRGYILLSQSFQSGRIWRWEVGGGPIAIGKTLFMENSGCRSKQTCDIGSGAIAIDFHDTEHSQEGRPVIAEWGENRIIRLELTGARTPLVLNVPSLCSKTHTQPILRRVYRPTKAMFTPFGDLVFLDHEPDCDLVGLYLLPNAMQIPPIESALESRKAHKWTDLPLYDQTVRLLYSAEATQIGDLALDEHWTGLYVSVRSSKTKKTVLLHLENVIENDHDEDEDDNQDETDEDNHHSAVSTREVYSWGTELDAGPLAMDNSHHCFIAVQDQLYILNNNNNNKPGEVLGQIKLPAKATSVTLAEDGFLYVTTASDLYRIKTRSKPMKIPTNLVRKVSKKKK